MTSTASDEPIAHVEAEQPGLDAGDEPARIARPLRDLVERAADDGPLDVARPRGRAAPPGGRKSRILAWARDAE